MSSGPMTVRNDHVLEKIMAPWWKNLGVWVYAPILIIVVTALTFVYLAQASYVATQVELMTKREQQLHEVKQAISGTRLKIAHYEDIDRIRAEARAMGLGEPSSIEYVEVTVLDPLPNASAGLLPASSSPVWNVEGSSSADTGWLSIIVQQFRNWTGYAAPESLAGGGVR